MSVMDKMLKIRSLTNILYMAHRETAWRSKICAEWLFNNKAVDQSWSFGTYNEWRCCLCIISSCLYVCMGDTVVHCRLITACDILFLQHFLCIWSILPSPLNLPSPPLYTPITKCVCVWGGGGGYGITCSSIWVLSSWYLLNYLTFCSETLYGVACHEPECQDQGHSA